jgi:hypothetical protein
MNSVLVSLQCWVVNTWKIYICDVVLWPPQKSLINLFSKVGCHIEMCIRQQRIWGCVYMLCMNWKNVIKKVRLQCFHWFQNLVHGGVFLLHEVHFTDGYILVDMLISQHSRLLKIPIIFHDQPLHFGSGNISRITWWLHYICALYFGGFILNLVLNTGYFNWMLHAFFLNSCRQVVG